MIPEIFFPKQTNGTITIKDDYLLVKRDESEYSIALNDIKCIYFRKVLPIFPRTLFSYYVDIVVEMKDGKENVAISGMSKKVADILYQEFKQKQFPFECRRTLYMFLNRNWRQGFDIGREYPQGSDFRLVQNPFFIAIWFLVVTSLVVLSFLLR